MIGCLLGTLKERHAPEIIVLVQGIGYELETSLHTQDRLPELGEPVTLLTHLVIREDQHKLYGFISQDERSMFRTLIKINGVGPKLALQILSVLTPKALLGLIEADNVAGLTQLPGIGKKTAERLLIELKDKLKFLSRTIEPMLNDTQQDALNALIALGYHAAEIRATLKQIDVTTLSTESIIRAFLKKVTGNNL